MNKAVAVHAIIFDKMIHQDVEQAGNIAKANDFSVDKFFENDEVFGFIQREKADFEIGAFGDGKDFRGVLFSEGAVALVGQLLEDVSKAVKNRVVMNNTIERNKTFLFLKQDEAKRVVTGPVLVPDAVDLQGDFEFPEDIEMAAFKFLEDARNIGEMHTKFGGIGVPVESWLLRESLFVDLGDRFKIYPKGTWMMSVKVTDDKVWEKVRNGELTGFSIGFRGTREAA